MSNAGFVSASLPKMLKLARHSILNTGSFPFTELEVYDEEGVKISEQTEDRPAVDNNPIVMDLLGCVQALQQQIAELKTSLASITTHRMIFLD